MHRELSLDSVLDFKELRKIIPEKIAMIGNLDPVEVFFQSTPLENIEAFMKAARE